MLKIAKVGRLPPFRRPFAPAGSPRVPGMRLRTPGPSRPALRRLLVICVAAALGAAGCTPTEQVSKYTAPRDPVEIDLISDEPGDNEDTVRVLGAIAPAGNSGEEWYFFKMQPSPPKAVARHLDAFDQFVESIRFPADGPPTWTLPAGWRQVGSQGKERIATIRMKKSETTIELTVTRFGGTLISNINRWREQQAGAAPIAESEIDTKCRVLTVDGRKVVIVDVSGPGGKGGMPK